MNMEQCPFITYCTRLIYCSSVAKCLKLYSFTYPYHHTRTVAEDFFNVFDTLLDNPLTLSARLLLYHQTVFHYPCSLGEKVINLANPLLFHCLTMFHINDLVYFNTT